MWADNDDSGLSEAEDAAVTHILTYGYPGGDDPIWQTWHAAGISPRPPQDETGYVHTHESRMNKPHG